MIRQAIKVMEITKSKLLCVILVIVTLSILSPIYPNVQAQTNIPFTSADKFAIPIYNGTISFALNGSYSQATLQNDSWNFVNLRLTRSFPLQNFTISVLNCNITVISYSSTNITRQTRQLRYSVEGDGKQIFNFGEALTGGGQFSSVDWSVITENNVFLAEGEGWTISKTRTITVNEPTGTYRVVDWGIFGITGSNGPFYAQHSVAIATGVVVGIIICVSIILTIRSRKHSSEKEFSENLEIIQKQMRTESQEENK